MPPGRMADQVPDGSGQQLPGPLPGALAGRNFRKAAETAPDPATRTPLEQQSSAAADEEQPHLPGGATIADGIPSGPSGFRGPGVAAIPGKRAVSAVRIPGPAEKCTEIHHALRVGSSGLLRQERAGQCPEAGGFAGIPLRIAAERKAGQETPDVAVEDGVWLVVAQGEDGSGGRGSDPGQFEEGLEPRGEVSARPHDPAGRLVQMMRAGVVAETGEMPEHGFRAGPGQIPYRGEALEEAIVVGLHGFHPGLLEHDFRDPDAIGIAGFLPGKVMASMSRLPGDDPAGKVAGCPCRNPPPDDGRTAGRRLPVHRWGIR